MKFRRMLTFVACLISACTTNDLPTRPGERRIAADRATTAPASTPASAVFMRPHFFFLPPLVKGTDHSDFSGTFDGSLSPVVTICPQSANACADTVARFTRDDGHGHDDDRGQSGIRVDGQQYQVDWHTGRSGLTNGADYLITVTLDGTLLGSIHFVAQSDGNVNRDRAAEDDTPTPGAPLTLHIGETLPIRFRIETGVAYIVGPAGGTISALGGTVTIVIPPGAACGPTAITVDAANVEGSSLANAYAVRDGAADLGPSGTVFCGPITITMRYNPAGIPGGFDETTLRLGTFIDGHWQRVAASTVNPSAHTVTGTTNHFTLYDPLVDGTYNQVSVGDNFACGISPSGSAYCWGSGSAGQLGAPTAATCGTSRCSLLPQAVAGGFVFSSVTAGGDFACGLTSAGDAYCWGANAAGTLGNAAVAAAGSATPVLVSGGLHFTTLRAGLNDVCGLVFGGDAYCWGANDGMVFGSSPQSSCPGVPGLALGCATVPTHVVTPSAATDIEAGIFTACTLDVAGAAYCWGANRVGVVGNGTTTAQPTPVPVSGGLAFQSISTGAIQTCGLTLAGAAYCWGANFMKQLGNGSTTPSSVPVPVSGGLTFSAISSSKGNDIFTHTCALTTAGAAYCWGSDSNGQLGVASGPETCGVGSFTSSCSGVPIAVATSLLFRTIATGLEETCGVATNGMAYCWGMNTLGQLGDGTTTTRSTPGLITSP